MANNTKSKKNQSTNRRNTSSNTKKRNTSNRSTSRNSNRTSNGKKKSGYVPVAERRAAEERQLAAKQNIILAIVIVVGVILFASVLNVGGAVGAVLSNVLFGVFGILAYIVPFCIILITFFYFSNRNNLKQAIPMLLSAIGLFLLVDELIELIYHGDSPVGMVDGFNKGWLLHEGGGFFGGLLASIFVNGFGIVPAYIITIVLMILCIALIMEISVPKSIQNANDRYNSDEAVERRRERRERAEELKRERHERELAERSLNRREIANAKLNDDSYTTSAKPLKDSSDEINEITIKSFDDSVNVNTIDNFNLKSSDNLQELRLKKSEEVAETKNDNSVSDAFLSNAEKFAGIPANQIERQNAYISSGQNVNSSSLFENQKEEIEHSALHEIKPIEEEKQQDYSNNICETVSTQSLTSEKTESQEPVMKSVEDNVLSESFTLNSNTKEDTNTRSNIEVVKDETHKVSKASEQPINTSSEKNGSKKKYVFPPVNLLTKLKKNTGDSDASLKETANKLQQTLINFGVDAKVTNATQGPAVTRYEVEPAMGVKVSKIVGLTDDIKLNLAAAEIRIEAPIPGKSAVGIEVPNKTASAVSFRELVESEEFKNVNSNIAFAAGKDIGGKIIISDIAKMPHLLIAGSTGSGKSVCINTIIMSMLYHADPKDVKFIMIDPKVVELSVYNGIPHLLIPVVTDPKKAAGALNWAVNEMTKRYNAFAEYGVRDMKGYNSLIHNGVITKDVNGEMTEIAAEKMPHIVIIVDELADLMMVASQDVETSICRIAQLARAAGIHLIIATQRPTVNVITGLIKANMPSRIAFAVTSGTDSRTILDMNGAERLLGKGDMLYFPQGLAKPIRVQGAFCSDDDVKNVVDFIKKNNQSDYDESINSSLEGNETQATTIGGDSGSDDGRDSYFADAGRLIIEKEKGSIGFLQRNFRIGFNRAARIMDQLEEAGVVGPEEGTKPRKILVSMEEFEQLLNNQ